MLRINEAFALDLPKISEAAHKRVTEALLPSGGSAALEVTIAAIHEGLTRNNTNYSKEGLTHKTKNDQGQPGGLESWTKPYNAPIVKDHEASADNVIGRVSEAVWREREGSEPGHVELKATITNPDAIEKFLRGEYNTGSIGMDVDTATCSICNADFMKGWRSACEHERGKWYRKEKGADGETWVEADKAGKGARRMHINIGNTWAREYSVVAVPSDAKSKVKGFEVKEMYFSEGTENKALNLLDPAAWTEAEVVPAEENQPAVRSVAELVPAFYEQLESDPTGLFFFLAEAARDEQPLVIEDASYTQAELLKLLDHIVVTNEDIEDELNLIRECVLSSETTKNLPDSSFAFVGSEGRAFPYRDAENIVNAEQLLTSLAWVRSSAHLTGKEIAKATRKLMAAARKAKVGQSNRAQEIEDAKALLAEEKLVILTTEEHEALKPLPFKLEDSLQAEIDGFRAKIESLETSLAEANQILAERELENTELMEQASAAEEKLVTAIKTQLIEKILLLQEIEETEVEAKRTELLAHDASFLEGTLATLETENPGGFIIQRVPVGGLNLDESVKDELTTESLGITNELVIAASLGNKRARRQLESVISKVRK